MSLQPRSHGSTIPVKQKQTLIDRLDQGVFNAIYSRSLVYNTCWEDPAVDRRALNIGPADSILVITSAGCNALDYLLAGPAAIHAVDANPRQNALLELKLAAIRHLSYEDFFALFGTGRHLGFETLYRQHLRADLSPFARRFWDRRAGWFQGPRQSFYYNGLSGTVARAFRAYLRMRPKLYAAVLDLFKATSLPEQQQIYHARVAPKMWSRGMNWILARQITMSMLGVPHPQRKEVQAQHVDGVAGFIRHAIEYVMCDIPLADNYFYAVYLHGSYTEACCPAYLKRENFEILRATLDRVHVHTCTVTDFLRAGHEPISRFVLLDHMDWMSSYYPEALVEEWDAILERASPDTRIILRSAHQRPAYLDWVRVGPNRRGLREVLTFHDDWARELTLEDRVHTYAGFHIADLGSPGREGEQSLHRSAMPTAVS